MLIGMDLVDEPIDQLGLVISEYLGDLLARKVYSHNTLRLYKRDLVDFDSFCKEEYPNIDIRELAEKHLNKFRTWLKNKGGSTAAINRKFTALHGLWIWLRETKQVERDPFTQIVRESQFRNEKASYLSQEEITKLLDCPDLDLRTKLILELMYATGIRIGELSQLTLTDIDIENQLLTIPRKARKKERVIPFNKLVQGYLNEYIEENELEADHKLLFTRKGYSMSEREIFRLIREAAKKAGISKKVSPSIIRNSFIYHLKENGAHDVFIRDLAGQKSF